MITLIVGNNRDENNFGTGKWYVDFASMFGSPLTLTQVAVEDLEPILPSVSLVIFPGGPDISPIRYGQIPSVSVQKADPFFDYADQILLPFFIEHKVPVLGICRGLQAINVLYGGDLYQEIGSDHPRSENYEVVHDVSALESDGRVKFRVNSSHHQSILKVGDGLYPIAWSEDDLIEAVMHFSDPVLGVQWHPEMLDDNDWLIAKLASIGVKIDGI